MKKSLLLLLSVFALQYVSFAQEEATTAEGKKVILWEDGTWVSVDSLPLHTLQVSKIAQLELPASGAKETLIKHTGFTLLYNETHEQAAWVAYELTKEETNKVFERTDKFMVDPLVKTGSATDKDYAASGYDRGHLAPAADMAWSATTIAESFYYSNMSPQAPSFNRGVWKSMEELVRFWAIENSSVYVVTGPVLSAGLPTIGPNQVSVPTQYYKVILDYTAPSIKGIGFILPNAASSEPLQHFAVSIDSVEIVTGIDFFSALPDEQEKLIEKTLCSKCWTWKSSNASALDEEESDPAVVVQCKGKTKAGDRCKSKTSNSNGYCNAHASQYVKEASEKPSSKAPETPTAVQCSATTKVGSRCKRSTQSPNGKCYQHGGN